MSDNCPKCGHQDQWGVYQRHVLDGEVCLRNQCNALAAKCERLRAQLAEANAIISSAGSLSTLEAIRDYLEAREAAP